MTKIDLRERADWVRGQVIEMCRMAEGGHAASSLSIVELLVVLYYGKILHYKPTDPHWDERDRFILSKGHGVVALYPILADLGFFPKEELAKMCKPGGMLGSHPDAFVPGIELTTGSLGHGLGVGAGMALGFKMDGLPNKVVVLLGDGECQEGAVWEAAMFAAQHNLDNLTAIIDRNRLSTIDFTEKYLKLEPFSHKWKAFGWNVDLIIDGHSCRAIKRVLKMQYDNSKPRVIIANTVKGKGVPEFENNPRAHTMIPGR